jgi:poly(3-hydroxybutyrate) depolymerase
MVTGLGITDLGLTPRSSYSYTVAAKDNNGNVSADSAPITVKTGTQMATGANLSNIIVGGSLINYFGNNLSANGLSGGKCLGNGQGAAYEKPYEVAAGQFMQRCYVVYGATPNRNAATFLFHGGVGNPAGNPDSTYAEYTGSALGMTIVMSDLTDTSTGVGVNGMYSQAEINYVNSVMDDVLARYPTKGITKFNTLGFSAGGALPYLIGCNLSGRVGAIVVFGGGNMWGPGRINTNRYFPCTNQGNASFKPVAVLDINGSQDTGSIYGCMATRDPALNDITTVFGGSCLNDQFVSFRIDDPYQFGNDAHIGPGTGCDSAAPSKQCYVGNYSSLHYAAAWGYMNGCANSQRTIDTTQILSGSTLHADKYLWSGCANSIDGTPAESEYIEIYGKPHSTYLIQEVYNFLNRH